MRFSFAGTFIAYAAGVAAFKDTSPFLIFSTAESSNIASTSQIQSRTSVLESAQAFLSHCPTDTYIILQQSGVTKEDVRDATISKILKDALVNEKIKHFNSVSQVVDGIDGETITSYVTRTCAGELVSDFSTNAKTSVISIAITDSPSSSDEKKIVAILESLPESYTVIYTTIPPSHAITHPPYEPEFIAQEPLHVEMKRHVLSRRDNSSAPQVPKNAPLFEKYQFFTPGLFMGIIVSLLLLGILSVALRAVSSLSVSYGAFDKEMGPAAQKKQQ